MYTMDRTRRWWVILGVVGPLLGLAWLLTSGPVTAAAVALATAVDTASLAATLPITGTLDPAEFGYRETWLPPINLSQSGATGDPIFLMDDGDRALVLWRDDVAGFMYTRNDLMLADEAGWTAPENIEVPFENASPILTRSDNRLVAVWIGGEDSDKGSGPTLANILYYSRVIEDDLGPIDAWRAPAELAEAALDYDVAGGRDDRLHLVYIGSPEANATSSGLYYHVSTDEGATWSEGALLFESPYLRPEVAETGHIALVVNVVNDVERINVVWDNAAVEKVFTVHSPDGGETWLAPVEVDGREASDLIEAVGPNGIEALAQEDNVVLVWQAGHAATKCGLYYRSSNDAGVSWSARRPVPLASSLCPNRHQLIGPVGRMGLLLTSDLADTALYGWNGRVWSSRQLQEPLRRFQHPTTFRDVSFGCLTPAATRFGLVVVGCGEGTTPDIWLTLRATTDVRAWFARASAWAPAQDVGGGGEPLQAFALTGDGQGSSHLFWSEVNSEKISYALGSGSRWSTPFSVLKSPQGAVGEIAATATPGGRVALVWQDIVAGLEFSQVAAEQAVFATKWSIPSLLPGVPPEAAHPAIAADDQGNLYVAFTVRFNEARGIYVMRLDQDTQRWSAPVQLFDGAAAGWQVVGAPQLAVTGDGVLHFMWPEERAGGNDETSTIALHYARSVDGGQTLETPQQVFRGPVTWASLQSLDNRVVHRLYLAVDGSAHLFGHQQSPDSGRTWQAIPPLANIGRPLAATLDRSGRLHLVQMTPTALEQWQFENGRWRQVDRQTTDQVATTVALASSGRDLVAVYAYTAEAALVPDSLAFMLRPLVAPATRVTLPPLPAQPAGEVPSLPVVEEGPVVVEETPQRSFADVPAPVSNGFPLLGNLFAGDSQTDRLLASVLPAGVLVGLLVIMAYVAGRGFQWLTVRRSQ